MKHIILADRRISGTTRVFQDAFVPIGDGLEVLIPKDVQNGDTWELEIEPLKVAEHLHTTYLDDQLLVTNEAEILSAVHGNLLITNNQTDGSTNPEFGSEHPLPNHRATAIELLFNHVFIARGRNLWWTDLSNIWNWFPSTDSEADFRFIEWEQDDISALVQVNEVLYMHFPTAVYEVAYTGKPLVVRILERAVGAGAISSRAVQVAMAVQYFLSAEGFYLYTPDAGKQNFGADIWDDFAAEVTDFLSVWSYHDRVNQEICFVTPSSIWAYNYTERHWQRYTNNTLTDHVTLATSSNFTTIADHTEASIAKVRLDGMVNVWTGEDGLLREYVFGDDVGGCLEMGNPFLESDDFTYGDVHFRKTVDDVVVDFETSEEFEGLVVWVSGRDGMTHVPVWKEFTKMNTPGDNANAPAVKGKVLRVKLEAPVRYHYLDGSRFLNGGQDLSGLFVPSLDGHDKLDGSLLLDDFGTPVYDGRFSILELGYPKQFKFEIAAVGFRVDLPAQIGPDK